MISNVDRTVTHQVRAFLKLLRPFDLVDAARIRLGRNFDGGYVMADRFEGVQAAYSLGINNDVSWDFDIAMRGIDIYQYDHTIDALPLTHRHFHWTKKGIGPHPNDEHETIERLIDQNGHAGCENLVLKCDIEGWEWLAIAFTPGRILAKFSQIVLEFHDLGRLTEAPFAHTARQVALNLTTSHRVIHVHGNNHSPFAVVGGIPVPNVLEVTFARKDLGTFRPSTRTFPSEDDMPCHPGHADLHLGSFVY